MTTFSLLTELHALIPQRVFKDFSQNDLLTPDATTLYVTLEQFLIPPVKSLNDYYSVYYLLSDVFNNIMRIASDDTGSDSTDTEFLMVLTKLLNMGPMTYVKTNTFILDVSRLDIDPSESGGDFTLDVSRLDIDPASSGEDVVTAAFSNAIIARCIQAYGLLFSNSYSLPHLKKSLALVFNSPIETMYTEQVGMMTNVYLDAVYTSDVNIGLIHYITPTRNRLYTQPSYGQLYLRFK